MALHYAAGHRVNWQQHDEYVNRRQKAALFFLSCIAFAAALCAEGISG